MYLIGNGIDIHKLKKNNKLIPQKLAGVSFDLEYSIVAHSDGDIILHAISNSILGALSLEDIGTYFDDQNDKNKNIDSIKILDKAINEMNIRKYHVHNLDITIICEKIYFKQLKKEIKNNLINLLKTKNISIKATRFEQDIDLIQVSCSLLLKTNN